MKRAHLYLEERQDKELSRRAVAEGVTKSALIRRALDAYLDDTADETTRLAAFKAAARAAAGTAPYLSSGSAYVERLRRLDTARREELERLRRHFPMFQGLRPPYASD